jgi:hypothetical protein
VSVVSRDELIDYDAKIAECRRELTDCLGRLHTLQSLRNQRAGVSFVTREHNGRQVWFVLLNGKTVCREYGYSTLGTAMAAATQIKAIRDAITPEGEVIPCP